MKKHKRQILIILSAIFGIIPAIGVANYFVDPYAIYFSYDKPTYLIRPKAADNTRLEKLAGIIREKPEIIFLGSSVTNHGYNIKDPAIKEVLEKYKLRKVYNAAVSGGRVTESRHMLEHAIANNPNLKEVVISLDVMGLTYGYHDENSKKVFEEIAGHKAMPISTILRTTITADALFASIKTISPKAAEIIGKVIPQAFAAEEVNKKYIVDSIGGRDLTIMLTFCDWQLYIMKERMLNNLSKEFVDEKVLGEIEKIVQLSQEHNVKLHILISPVTPTYILSLRSAGVGGTYEEIVRKVTEFYSVLDFISYDELWDPDVRKGKGYFLGDPLHFPPAVGQKVLDKVFSGDVGDVLVTKNNFAKHVLSTNHKIDQWLERNTYSRDYMKAANDMDFSKQNKALIPSDINKFPPTYQESYKDFAIFIFMGNIYSIPEEYAPYDLLKIKTTKYKNIMRSQDVDSARKRIDDLLRMREGKSQNLNKRT